MKLALFEIPDGQRSLGAIDGNEVVALHSPIDPTDGCLLRTFLERREAYGVDPFQGRRQSIEEVTLLPPALGSGAIFCVGVNYESHARSVAERAGKPFDRSTPPALFMKTWGALTGHGQPIYRPKASDWFDFEGELVVVIGKRCRAVPRETALSFVAGYSIGNDGSVRDWQRNLPTPTAGKNFWHSGAIGPWMVTADEIPDPSILTIRTKVDGEILQSGSVGELLNDIPALIAHISTFTPLNPGDVIFTGTPAGCFADRGNQRWLKAGEKVSVEIDGLGTLTNTVVDEDA